VSQTIDAWYYEWGGGACSTLNYQPLGSGQWTVAPASFFSQNVTQVTQHDPALKTVLDQKTAVYLDAVASEEAALQAYNNAGDNYTAVAQTYSDANQVLISKQATLASDDQSVSACAGVWQTATDNKAVKDGALLTLQTKYKATFDAITGQAQTVSSLENQVAQAKATLAAIPKPASPSKVAKKVITKPAPPAKVMPKGKFVPVPKS